MTGFWIKFENARLSKNRAVILSMLGNDESAIAVIEGALSRYFAFEGRVEVPEKLTEVRDDLIRLEKALSTVSEVLHRRGGARWSFLDACGVYPEDGTLARFMQLEGALSDDGSDVLLEAVKAAIADVKLKVKSGTPPSTGKMGRKSLVRAIAMTAEKTGYLKPGRNKEFVDLVQAIYDSAEITSAKTGENIDADGDIRDAGV